jgi:hypothetical protein
MKSDVSTDGIVLRLNFNFPSLGANLTLLHTSLLHMV